MTGRLVLILLGIITLLTGACALQRLQKIKANSTITVNSTSTHSIDVQDEYYDYYDYDISSACKRSISVILLGGFNLFIAFYSFK